MTDNPDETLPVELLPCPFCGGEAYIEPNSSGLVGEDWPRIRCHQCDAKGPVSDVMNDTKPAIAAWNRRAAQSPPVNERWSLQFSNTPPSVTIWTAPLGHEPRTHSVAYIEFSSKAEKVFLAPAFRAIVSAHNAALDVAQSPPPVVSEGIERDIRIAIWNAGKWQGKPDEVAQSLIRKAMVEPTMIRALSALSSPSRGCDAETVEACAKLIETRTDLKPTPSNLAAAIRNLGKETRQGEG